MITKYIGSLSDLVNCSNIALVLTKHTLLESEIGTYTIENTESFNLKKILTRDPVNEVYGFKVEETLVFDAVIMYTSDMIPLGFTMLNYIINTARYEIKEIEVKLDFAITQSDCFIEISLSTDYVQHALKTASAHKNLVNNVSVEKSQISYKSKPSSYTNVLGKKNKVYRYSGNLMKNTELFVNNKFVQIPWIGDITEVIRINSIDYLITAKSNEVIVATSRSFSKISLPNPVTQVGRNVIICKDEVYSLNLLRNPKVAKLGTIQNNSHTVKNLITKDIYFYHVEDQVIVPDSIELVDIIDRFQYFQFDGIKELVGVGPNLLIYRLLSENSIWIRLDKTPGDSDLQAFQYEFEFNELKALSNECFLIRKTSNNQWYSLEVRSEGGINKLKSYNLGTDNNWKRLDRFSHNQINPLELSVLFTPCEGRLYKVENVGKNKVVSVL